MNDPLEIGHRLSGIDHSGSCRGDFHRIAAFDRFEILIDDRLQLVRQLPVAELQKHRVVLADRARIRRQFVHQPNRRTRIGCQRGSGGFGPTLDRLRSGAFHFGQTDHRAEIIDHRLFDARQVISTERHWLGEGFGVLLPRLHARELAGLLELVPLGFQNGPNAVGYRSPKPHRHLFHQGGELQGARFDELYRQLGGSRDHFRVGELIHRQALSTEDAAEVVHLVEQFLRGGRCGPLELRRADFLLVVEQWGVIRLARERARIEPSRFGHIRHGQLDSARVDPLGLEGQFAELDPQLI